MATGDFWGRIINGPGADSNWNTNWVGEHIGDTLLGGSQNDWAEFFRNVGWGPGAARGSMFQTVSPFAYQSYAKNAAQYLPSQFYVNAFANLYNNPANLATGGDPFGAEALRSFLPKWASGTTPNANQDLAGARNQFNQAIGNMSSAWNTYNAQEQNLNDATATWNTALTNIDDAIASYNAGVTTSASGQIVLSSSAQLLQPIIQRLANLGLIGEITVSSALPNGVIAHMTGKYKRNDDAWKTDAIIQKLPQLKPIVDELSDNAGSTTNWMNYGNVGSLGYKLAYAALSGDSSNYYDPAVGEAGRIANTIGEGGSAATQYQKMFVQMLLNALGQGWGGAFHNAYVQDLQQKLNDYAALYSNTNQNFFQWLANLYNGYLR